MTDTLSRLERSARMSLIKSVDTKPEIAVRKLLHEMGYRYRLHQSQLPGKPDICFLGKKKVIFVNGCFWHGHKKCPKARIPKSRTKYWVPKLRRNIDRDVRNRRALSRTGWRSLVIWECEIRNPNRLESKRRPPAFE